MGEFFALYWRPRGGKTGFMKFLHQRKLRTIEWCCIFLRERIKPAKVSEISKISSEACKALLEKLASNHRLRRVGRHEYDLVDEDKMIEELMYEYELYQRSKPTIKDAIVEIMLDHEKMSGKEIHNHLKVRCDPSTVYGHLKTLERAGIVTKVGQIRRRAIPEVFYALKYPNVEAYENELLKGIGRIFGDIQIGVREKFYSELLKKKPHAIRVFSRQLVSILAQDKHDYSSWQIWVDLLDNIAENGFSSSVSRFLRIKSNKEQYAEMKRLVEKFNISPALLWMLLLFCQKAHVDRQ